MLWAPPVPLASWSPAVSIIILALSLVATYTTLHFFVCNEATFFHLCSTSPLITPRQTQLLLNGVVTQGSLCMFLSLSISCRAPRSSCLVPLANPTWVALVPSAFPFLVRLWLPSHLEHTWSNLQYGLEHIEGEARSFPASSSQLWAGGRETPLAPGTATWAGLCSGAGHTPLGNGLT